MRVGSKVMSDPIRELLNHHASFIGAGNHYCYFELAYTRQTEWMAWICSKPREDDPNRKVITSGQGSTPDEACQRAIDNLEPSPTATPGGRTE